MKTRPAKALDLASLKTLFEALDRYAVREGVVGYRTRAFATLLADGALRSGSAIWLDIEEVVQDPESTEPQIVSEATLRASEGTKYRSRKFTMSHSARAAIADYLKAARDAGWLADRTQLKGPLWIAARHAAGTQQRLSQRAAIQAWGAFLHSTPELDQDYQMDDLVLTGRVRLAAAGASHEQLSEHAGITPVSAARISEHLPSRPGSTSDMLASLDRPWKPEPPRSAPMPAASSTDVFDQIKKLGELRDAERLTEEEFQTAKRKLLDRI